MSEERGFEVVDKRRVRADGAPAGEAPRAGDEEDDLFTQEDAAEMGEFNPMQMLGAMTVSSILGTTVGLLADLAVVHMGLMPNPATGQIETRLPEARRAIDAVEDLAKHLRPHVDDREKRQLDNLLADLRINFVKQSSR